MRTCLLALTALAFSVFATGCAADLHAGGKRGGVNAGASIAPPPPVVYPAPDAAPPPGR